MTDATIEVEGLGKRYRLGEQSSYGTAVARLSRRPGTSAEPAHVWALRDVDLVVREGEALGLIGANGSGKTTLLRILARITQPTVGVSRTRGRIGALLEIGTGFHPELSGHDNIYLSGAVMGMSRRDIKRRYSEIVEFSGVEPFIATPLKRYSSGMGLRLAFAVAAHLEPDLVFVDEVLAVGDFDFQRRCLHRMAALKEEGRTVVFVSHDLGAITRLCSRGVWLEAGQVQREGTASEVVSSYIQSALTDAGHVDLPVTGPAAIKSVSLLDSVGRLVDQPQRGDQLAVELGLHTTEHVPGLNLTVSLLTSDGTRMIDEAWSDSPDLVELAPGPGEWAVRLAIPPFLRAADYTVSIWLGTESRTFLHREVLTFQVAPLPTDRLEWHARPRSVQPPVTWSRRRLDGAS